MSNHQDPTRLIIGVGTTTILLAMAGVSVFSVRGYSAASLPPLVAARDGNAEDKELERCRTITTEQNTSDDACRRAWAKQRRHFFGLDQPGSKAPIMNVPMSPSQSSEPPAEATKKGGTLHPTSASPQKD